MTMIAKLGNRLISLSFRTLGMVLMAVAFQPAIASPEPTIPGRRPAQKANEWHAAQSWLPGCNFIPSAAVNQLEMWQSELCLRLLEQAFVRARKTNPSQAGGRSHEGLVAYWPFESLEQAEDRVLTGDVAGSHDDETRSTTRSTACSMKSRSMTAPCRLHRWTRHFVRSDRALPSRWSFARSRPARPDPENSGHTTRD